MFFIFGRRSVIRRLDDLTKADPALRDKRRQEAETFAMPIPIPIPQSVVV